MQRLRSLRYDCDADALLALVEPAGPACHTGERTCFYRSLGDDGVAPTRRCPRSRARSPSASARCPTAATRPSCSAPARTRIGAKVEEEAEEVARAAREESDERLREEAADLLYHLGVLLEARGLTYADALDELTHRMSR